MDFFTKCRMNGHIESSSPDEILTSLSKRPPADGKEDRNFSRTFDSSDKQLCPEYRKIMSCVESEGAVASFLHNESFKGEECCDSSFNCSPPVEQSTPPCLKWAQNIHFLLDDPDGVQVFQEYLREESYDKRCVDFWFACQGFKKGDQNKKKRIAKLINSKYVRSLSEIKTETKHVISNRIASKDISTNIFDQAQREVEEVMIKTIYPNFLRSDIYLQCVQKMQNNACNHSPDETCSAGQESTRSVSRDALELLPTVHEDSELQITCSKFVLTREALYQRTRYADLLARPKPEAEAGHYLKPQMRNYNPYYAKSSAFLPTSAQDSELQSLSSDAQTDDTMSLSESIDCRPVQSNEHYQKKCIPGRHGIYLNKDYLDKKVIPRTERLSCEYLKSLKPKDFMSLLLPKLEKVVADKKIENLQWAENSKECTKSSDSAQQPYLRQVLSKQNTVFNSKPDNELHAQMILDQHISRVWEDSAQQTPVRTPDCSTPPGAQPCPEVFDQYRVSYHGSGNNQYPNNNYESNLHTPRRSQCNAHYLTAHSSRHRKECDAYLCDVGAIRDSLPMTCVSEHETSHHVVSHRSSVHHHNQSNYNSEQYAGPFFDSSSKWSRKLSKRSTNRKLSIPDDSGISTAGDTATMCSVNFEKKPSRTASTGNSQNNNVSTFPTSQMTVIGYCFGSKSVPFLTKLPGKNITLKQFKSLIAKKGNFKYFFKKASNDFGTGVVLEEVSDDREVLPLWEGKIFCVIEQID